MDVQLGTSATNSYADTTAAAATNYTYTVSAVNRDGYASAQSTSIVADLPGVTSYVWLDSQDIAIYFSEPLTSATATVLGNYTMSGGITFSAVALSRDGTAVTLTTTQALTAGNAYTITMNGLATVSGDQLPASLPLAVTYQTPTGEILDQVWDNLDGGDTINDLTNPALNPNYPNNPTYTHLLDFVRGPVQHGSVRLRPTGPGLHLSAHDGQLRVLDRQRRLQPVVALDELQPQQHRQQPDRLRQRLDRLPSVDHLREPAIGADLPGRRAALLHRGPDEAGRRGRQSLRGLELLPSGGTSVPAQGSALSITGFTYSGTTATATLSAAPGFVVGQSVLVSGAPPVGHTTALSSSPRSAAPRSATRCRARPRQRDHRHGHSPTASATTGRPPSSGSPITVTPAATGSTSPARAPPYDGLYQITGVTQHVTYSMSARRRCVATGTINGPTAMATSRDDGHRLAPQ